MSKQPDKATKPTDDAINFVLPGDPAKSKAAARKLHGPGLGGMVYANAIAQRMKLLCGGYEVGQSGCNYIEDMLERMAPRDPLEEMLVVQAALAHARVLHLTEYANRQDRLEAIRTVHEYADKASNTFRRLMLALGEYRRPPRVGPNYTAIGQANIAGQQVVNNGEIQPNENATNEQGCQRPELPEALPIDTRGLGIAPGGSAAGEAVGAVHRTKDTRGQGPEQHERMAAR